MNLMTRWPRIFCSCYRCSLLLNCHSVFHHHIYWHFIITLSVRKMNSIRTKNELYIWLHCDNRILPCVKATVCAHQAYIRNNHWDIHRATYKLWAGGPQLDLSVFIHKHLANLSNIRNEDTYQICIPCLIPIRFCSDWTEEINSTECFSKLLAFSTFQCLKYNVNIIIIARFDWVGRTKSSVWCFQFDSF